MNNQQFSDQSNPIFTTFKNDNQSTSVGQFEEVKAGIAQLFEVNQNEQYAFLQNLESVQQTMNEIADLSLLIGTTTGAEQQKYIEDKASKLITLSSLQNSLRIKGQALMTQRTEQKDLVELDNSGLAEDAVYKANEKTTNQIYLSLLGQDSMTLSPKSIHLDLAAFFYYFCKKYMMRFLLSSIVFFLFISNVFSQDKYDYLWLFGYDSNPVDSTFGGSNIDFNGDTATLDYVFRTPDIGAYNASICDKDGNLLFYTNGCYIADASNEIMMNGDSINPGAVFHTFCEESTYPTSQNCFILPKPESDSLYFLFHKGEEYSNTPPLIYMGKLYYSIVDMTLNNGLGAVTQKNVLLLDDTISSQQFTAIKHSNNEDWWIMTPKYRAGYYCTFLFTNDSILGPFEQQIGPPTTNGGGQAVFSPNGNTYVRYTPSDGAFIFDFDRTTGLLSNYKHAKPITNGLFGGAAISPNNRYLYLNTWNKVFQYDLEAADIEGSEVTVAVYDGFLSNFPTNFYLAQLGPDCRIYINSTNGVNVLHVINQPDEPGLACEVIQHGIHLPTRHRFSLPNFPHYRLGTGTPPCNPDIYIPIIIDSIPSDTMVNSMTFVNADVDLSVFPNPVTDNLQIRCKLPSNIAATWILSDARGREVAQITLDDLNESYQISTIDLHNGIYFFQVRSDLGVLGAGKVIVQH